MSPISSVVDSDIVITVWGSKPIIGAILLVDCVTYCVFLVLHCFMHVFISNTSYTCYLLPIKDLALR